MKVIYRNSQQNSVKVVFVHYSMLIKSACEQIVLIGECFVTIVIQTIFFFFLQMDATKKPLVVPPDFSNYAESKGIFQVLQVSLYNFTAY